MTTHDAVLVAARRQDPEIGDNAMMVPHEYGYWIGSIYVTKSEVAEIMKGGK